ncbi:hypothetical protein [Alteriqipengyuania lutimaris]|uniref:Lipoprotein n=1 Tax=Alteriqipengyuania lutimaris TaxID=1538146 RepID=A0A395LKU4_9SPHN|nr:hypothetical protein [Alteriqipengyuania lutimaris]MBB3033553.1 hypothetical protein [Alteriqipengyuania lutimaris]RDS77441.1 hypothetical protein DL238_07360 [Alteriqipengyuania lutimaris]
MKNLHRSLVIGCSALALAGCGADEIVSPGTGGNVTINNPAPAPAPTPTPTPTQAQVTPAAGCPTIANPTGLNDLGTISGPTGEYRRCRLPGSFTASSTLPAVNGLLYELNGQTDVGTDQGFASTNTDVTLTIEPGVIIYASGNDFLNVNRGNQLNAIGTEAEPIIFTSRDNVLGSNNADSSGQWGGVILSGRAPVTDCFLGAEATNNCERRVEGATNQILYGGAQTGDSSGTLSYVQIRYSGFALANGDELQSLTTGGIGSGTTLNHIQTYNSSDDGAEFFGGVVEGSRFIMVGAEDDSLDTDTGVKAFFDQLLVVQRNTASDTVIEQDSDGNENVGPRTNTRINNATFVIDSATGDRGIRIRGSSDFTLLNSLLVEEDGTACLNVQGTSLNGAAGSNADEAGPVVFNSVALDCATNFRDGGGNTAAQVETRFDAGTGNTKDFSNTLQRLTGVTTGAAFINGANENGYTPIFDATTVSSFFSTRTYIGAVTSQADNWAEGWTCNSPTVTLGLDNTGDCSTLPTA